VTLQLPHQQQQTGARILAQPLRLLLLLLLLLLRLAPIEAFCLHACQTALLLLLVPHWSLLGLLLLLLLLLMIRQLCLRAWSLHLTPYMTATQKQLSYIVTGQEHFLSPTENSQPTQNSQASGLNLDSCSCTHLCAVFTART
jgi:hypothetical protein